MLLKNSELNLIEYEGSVVDTGDSTVTAFVHKVFEQDNKGDQHECTTLSR